MGALYRILEYLQANLLFVWRTISSPRDQAKHTMLITKRGSKRKLQAKHKQLDKQSHVPLDIEGNVDRPELSELALPSIRSTGNEQKSE